MAEPQLSIRSAKALELAQRLARREQRSMTDVVERALEAYERHENEREPAEDFYARLSADAPDIDLEAVIRQSRRAHAGPDI